LTAENAEDEIDRVLAIVVLGRKLPGYLLLPIDVAQGEVSPPSGLWGCRVVDESAAAYVGTYVGAASSPEVLEAVEGAVVIQAGVQFTDLRSGFFSQHLQANATIDIGPRSISIGTTVFAPVAIEDALAAVTEILGGRSTVLAGQTRDTPPVPGGPAHEQRSGREPLDQNTLWNVVADALRIGDLILADQGTAFYGMGAHRLPHDVDFVGQPLWASIGYTLPALLGAALAAVNRRPIVLIGDGAAQLTIAELGSLARFGVRATVLVVDNDGYTVERAIHGPYAEYNDIAEWD
jgi:indolepyruvate decarboxylase